MIYYSTGSDSTVLGQGELREGLYSALNKIGSREKVIAVPPDITRFHSFAGELTVLAYKYFGNKLVDIMPALGTHSPMKPAEIDRMYPGVPHSLFRVHNWRKDVATVGIIPGSYVSEITGGELDFDWPAQLNKLIAKGNHDLVLSIGQVVPHEVIGMANHNKNLFVGTGGAEAINKSHFVGAVYGMERIMGRAGGPVRALLNYASSEFISHIPVVYVLTVVGKDEYGKLVVRGLYIGDDQEVFTMAAELSLKVNFNLLDKPLEKVVVYLDPLEYRSTWLGNKAIYRTRMAIADHGELIIIAPGIKEFGEDGEIDRLIREYGYIGTPAVLKAVASGDDLSKNLSAAAHLIHGSSEGRFSITYCPGKLSREEVCSVKYGFGEIDEMFEKYKPLESRDGYNQTAEGEEFYFISNPSLGLWSVKSKFNI